MRFQRLALLGGALTVIAGVALAAATGDRLKIPVLIGQGQNVLESAAFDQGLGTNNVTLTASTAHTLLVSSNGVGSNVPTMQIGPASSGETDFLYLGGAAGLGVVMNTPGTRVGMIYPTNDAINLGLNTSFVLPGSPVLKVTPTQVVAFQPTVVPTGSPGSPGLSGSASSTSGIIMDTASVQLVANSTHGLTVNALGATITGDGGGNVPHSCTIRSNAVVSSGSTVNCVGNEIVTGGGCTANSSASALQQGYPNSATAWSCLFNGGSPTVTAYAICCLK